MGVLSGGLSTLSQGRPPEPTIILNEFCLTTRYRKYAIRLLNGPAPEEQRVRRPRGRKPRYSKAVLSVLAAVWAAAGYPWSVRLKALLPSWLPWIRKHYHLTPEIEQRLLAISARQMDRRLRLHPESHRRIQRLDGIASPAGQEPGGGATGIRRDPRQLAFSPVGFGLRQRLGVHQLASETLG